MHAAHGSADLTSWKTAWDEYVRGNVVSDAAAKLIRTFLLNTMAATGPDADDDASEADASDDDTELPPLKLSGERFCALLQYAKDDNIVGDKTQGVMAKKSARLREYKLSHAIGERVWKTDKSDKHPDDRRSPGHMFEHTYGEHISALLKRTNTEQAVKAPFDEERDAAASYNKDGFSQFTIEKVLQGVLAGPKKPNKKQE